MRTCMMLLAAVTFGAGELAAQSAEDLLAIEIAAARHAVSDRNIARNMIEVDGAFAAPEGAPGSPTGSMRPAARTRAIRDAVTVPSTYRRPYGESLLLMSEPAVRGDVAQVTTTLFRATPAGRRMFETHRITLQRSGTGWSVSAVEKLGAG